jgi:hypothetical protein
LTGFGSQAVVPSPNLAELLNLVQWAVEQVVGWGALPRLTKSIEVKDTGVKITIICREFLILCCITQHGRLEHFTLNRLAIRFEVGPLYKNKKPGDIVQTGNADFNYGTGQMIMIFLPYINCPKEDTTFSTSE